MTPILALLTLTTLYQSSPQETFDSYLSALKAHNPNKAAACWTDEAVAESERLGIVFTDISPKYDNASPIVTHLAAIIKKTAAVHCGEVTTHDDWAELPVWVKVGADSVSTTYFFERVGTDWKISAPLFIHSRGWQVLETECCQINYRDSTLLNEYAIEQLDQYIESVCMKMGMSEAKLAGLQRIKIPYYLGDKDDVKALTGFETFGMTNLQFDAVITQYLPHPHELTHLLIDYFLKEQPLYTMPFLQEGLACHFGGRWGKSVAVIDQMGCYLLENEVVELDSVLTWRGFYQSVGMSDLSYPVSSEFVGFLIKEGGFEKFLELYRVLSAAPDSLMSLSVTQVHAQIERIYGVSWGELVTRFEGYRKQHTFSGIEPGGAAEGKAIFQIVDSTGFVKVSEGVNDYTISAYLGKADQYTNLLFIPNKHKPGSYRSKLFAEHFPGMTWHGEVGGIRFSSREAGYYDYRTNVLEAKYVTAFNPSDLFWDEKAQVVKFRIDKRLIKGGIEGYRVELR